MSATTTTTTTTTTTGGRGRARWVGALQLLLWWTLAYPVHAQSQQDLLPVEQAFRADHGEGGNGRLRLSWTIADDYYLYRDRIKLRALDPSHALPDLSLPPGEHKIDEYFGEVEVYRGHAEAWLTPTGGAAPAGRFSVSIQGCHEVDPLVCYPPFVQTLEWTADGVAVVSADGAGNAPTTAAAASAPASATSAPRADAATAIPASAGGVATVVGVLLLAALGGLILNLMPCVLPILSLKVLSLVQSGESPAAARRHALWYTAGVLVSFSALGGLVLAARSLGDGLGWGFQLQQPAGVAVLVYVMFVLGLSLSGAVVIASRLGGVGHALASRGGASGDFFTGVLAVVVASPCTAPFMGTALAFALTAAPALALLVFLALGFGLAAPFLAIGFIPALASWLPKPGRWMDTLKQVLAFPLYATAAWLAWVLTRQRGADGLAWLLVGLLSLAFGLWLAERLRDGPRPWLRGGAWLVVALALWPLWQIHRLPAGQGASAAVASRDGSVPYSAETLARLQRDGRKVLVNMTADWCVTCKANEKRLFDTDGFRSLLGDHAAVYVKGDWTSIDPAITRFLTAHGAVGVPLYVVFDGSTGRVDVLPAVPSRDQVDAALRGQPADPRQGPGEQTI